MALTNWPLARTPFKSPSAGGFDQNAVIGALVSGSPKAVQPSSEDFKGFDAKDYAAYRKGIRSGASHDELIKGIREYKASLSKPVEESKAFFQDAHAEEGVLEQAAKAPFRAIGNVAKSIVGGAETAFAGGVNLLEKGIQAATGIEMPGYEAGLWPTAAGLGMGNIPTIQESALSNVTAIPAGVSRTMFNLGKAPLAAGINLAAEAPGSQYVTQAFGKAIEGAGSWIGSVIGDEQAGHNIFETGLNLVWAKVKGGGVKEVGQAFRKGGLGAAVKEGGGTALKTAKDITTLPVTAPLAAGKFALSKVPKGVVSDIVDAGVEKAAGKVLGSWNGTKELFQATSPSINTLSKSRDIASFKEKAKLADEAVVESGRLPKNTSERAQAYRDVKKEIWNEVTKYRKGSVQKYEASKLADVIDQWIESLKVSGKINPAIKADIDALRKQSAYFRSLGQIDVPSLGNIRTQINAVTDWAPTKQFGDAFDSVMKKVAEEARNSENSIISSVFGKDMAGKMKKYGALAEMYQDVVKQDIVNLRKKGLGMEESFSRISGVGDVIGGAFQLITNPANAVRDITSGVGKIAMGKIAGKLKDPDYLISEGYRKLSESMKTQSKTPQPLSRTKNKPDSQRPQRELGTSPKTSRPLHRETLQGKRPTAEYTEKVQALKRPQEKLSVGEFISDMEMEKLAKERGTDVSKLKQDLEASGYIKNQGLAGGYKRKPSSWKTDRSGYITLPWKSEQSSRSLYIKARDMFTSIESMNAKYALEEIQNSRIKMDAAEKKFILDHTKKYIDSIPEDKWNPGNKTFTVKDFNKIMKEATGYTGENYKSIVDKSGETVTIYRAGELNKSQHGWAFFSENEIIPRKLYEEGERPVNKTEIVVPPKEQIASYRSQLDAYLDLVDGNRWPVVRYMKEGHSIHEAYNHLRYSYPELFRGYNKPGFLSDFNRKMDKEISAALKKRGVKLLEYTNPEDIFAQIGLEGSEFQVIDPKIIKGNQVLESTKSIAKRTALEHFRGKDYITREELDKFAKDNDIFDMYIVEGLKDEGYVPVKNAEKPWMTDGWKSSGNVKVLERKTELPVEEPVAVKSKPKLINKGKK